MLILVGTVLPERFRILGKQASANFISGFQYGNSQTNLLNGILALPFDQALPQQIQLTLCFSLFSGRAWLLGCVSALCILVGWRVLRRYRLGTISRAAGMLMLGGAIGNMIDRVWRGYVVDMFEVLFVEFAIFNVADAALTMGTILMGISLLFRPNEWHLKSSSTEAGKKG